MASIISTILKSNRNTIVFTRLITMSAQLRAEKVVEKLKEQNPYYEKYAQKIAKLQQTSPEEFLNRIEKSNEQKVQQMKKSKEQERYNL